MANCNTTKKLAYTMPLKVSEVPECVLHYRNIRNVVEVQLRENLSKESIKGEGKFKNGKLKKSKERINTNLCGQHILCSIYCNTTAILKFEFVYRQSKNYHPQTYDEECKYINKKRSQYSMLNPVETV